MMYPPYIWHKQQTAILWCYFLIFSNCTGSVNTDSMAMEMGNIELMVKLQVFTYIHDQRVVHRQFTPDTR